ncbi:MAG TPA: phosphoribosyltransferase family protein [Polyangiaceae bacterium]|nr:phosphoribosyltransferase family protein [Polyangiaceae bacterium]
MRSFRPWIAEALAAAEVLLSPPRCAACDAPLERPGFVCEACEPEAPAPVVETLPCGLQVVAVSAYDGALVAAVRRLKYEGRSDLARGLGERLSVVARRFLPRPDVLVPVPLHPARLADRTYNQAALVANGVGRALSVRVAPLGLVRLREGATQASLGRRDRVANASGLFAARERFDGEHVVVVDDVVTTGATAVAAAAATLLAGARSVSIAAVLRAGVVEGGPRPLPRPLP